jgi:hypothetical protein
MSSRFLGALVAAVALTACAAGAGDGSDRPKLAPSIRDLRTEDTTGPYVSVAVDNHFHDVHPEDNIRIAADRPFIVKNQGSNLHNVTIAGTDVDEDLKPGEQIEFDPVGEELGVGPHTMICRIHANRGMTGQFVVFEGT